MDLEEIYKNRFSGNKVLNEKNNIWKILCKHFFQRYIAEDSVLVDVGAGYCEFLNNIKAKKKYGFDLNPESKNFANDDVEFANKSIFDIELNEKANVVFVSHVLEHLSSKEEVINALKKFNQILKDKGKVIILTPNITLLGGRYWDFIDHKVPLNDLSIIEAGKLTGFECTKNIKRFLPYTTKSKIPKFGFLIWLYLKTLTISGFFMGKTSFIVLEKV